MHYARTRIKDDNSFVAVHVFYQSSSLIAETVVGHLIRRFMLGFTRERERENLFCKHVHQKNSECSFQTIASSFMRFLGTWKLAMQFLN